MSTLEALNAISEAIQAHAKLPEVERSLKEAREAHDFALLELDEANAKIAELRATIAEQQNRIEEATRLIDERNNTINDLTSRNTMLANSLDDAQTTIRNQQLTISEQHTRNDILSAENLSLHERLHEARGYGERLAETLRSIGSKIVAAVEVPEVTSEAPFPVANPVAMPDSPSDQSNDQSSSEPNGNVAESTVSDLVTPEYETTAPGTNVYKYW